MEQDNKLLRSEMDALAFTQRHMRQAVITPAVAPNFRPEMMQSWTGTAISPMPGTAHDLLPPLPPIVS